MFNFVIEQLGIKHKQVVNVFCRKERRFNIKQYQSKNIERHRANYPEKHKKVRKKETKTNRLGVKRYKKSKRKERQKVN